MSFDHHYVSACKACNKKLAKPNPSLDKKTRIMLDWVGTNPEKAEYRYKIHRCVMCGKALKKEA